jgi:uncharacterized protein YodC (DUF2158 family)
MFKIGDLVLLKSGGPVMTVSEEISKDSICVDWFKDEELKRDAFDPNELIKVN